VGLEWPPMYTTLPARMDTFALGALAAYLYVCRNDQRSRATMAAAFATSGAMLIGLFVFLGGYRLTSRDVLIVVTPLIAGFFSTGIFLSLVANKTSLVMRILSSHLLAFFGKYSYGLYVYHWVVYRTVKTQLPAASRSVLVFLLTNLITVSLAVLSYEFFEKQFMKMRPRAAPAFLESQGQRKH
jgi:peptidoglycan/LPS O-acetylase OafA/YrhL